MMSGVSLAIPDLVIGWSKQSWIVYPLLLLHLDKIRTCRAIHPLIAAQAGLIFRGEKILSRTLTFIKKLYGGMNFLAENLIPLFLCRPAQLSFSLRNFFINL